VEAHVGNVLNTFDHGDARATHLIVMPDGSIRRPMPVEYERWLGLPDNWTAKGLRPDGQVYDVPESGRNAMVGNACTTNVPQWIAERIYCYDTTGRAAA